MTEKPPQRGLTRTPTGHPHTMYRDWWITDAEMKRIQARADRSAMEDGTVPDEPMLSVEVLIPAHGPCWQRMLRRAEMRAALDAMKAGERHE